MLGQSPTTSGAASLRPLALLCAAILAASQSADAGDNADVEIGLEHPGEPCGWRGGEQLEFSVHARNMTAVAQVAVTISWQPAGAIDTATAEPGSIPKEVGLLAPFDPLVFDGRAEYGMAALGDDVAIEGEGELVTFRLGLADWISASDQVEIWVDAVSLGPSFSELDLIAPPQAVVLANFCSEFQVPISQTILVSPPHLSTRFSPPGSGAQLDGSVGEIPIRARFLREFDFAIDQLVTWEIGNEGDISLFLHTRDGSTQVHPNTSVTLEMLPNLRGNAAIVLDAEAAAADGGNATAEISVCAGSSHRCAETTAIWEVAATAVAIAAGPAPNAFGLGRNFPNPFNPATTIPFAISPPGGPTRLAVYNTAGQEVATLVDATLAPGRYEAGWNGLTQRGTAAASGVYFYRLQAGSKGQTRPMLLAR